MRLSISEEESWSALNSGRLAASVTTVDVLAGYGREFRVKVPAPLGFSRGADGVVVRSDVKRVNALMGRVVAAAQFTETDFFIRYLAQEAGIGVNAIGGLDATPDPERINQALELQDQQQIHVPHRDDDNPPPPVQGGVSQSELNSNQGSSNSPRK